MRVVFSVEARQHAARASTWYRERDARTMERFRTRLDAIVRLLGQHPESGTAIEGTPYRRIPMMPFPYIVAYEVRPEMVIVLAVLHTSQAPRSWVNV